MFAKNYPSSVFLELSVSKTFWIPQGYNMFQNIKSRGGDTFSPQICVQTTTWVEPLTPSGGVTRLATDVWQPNLNPQSWGISECDNSSRFLKPSSATHWGALLRNWAFVTRFESHSCDVICNWWVVYCIPIRKLQLTNSVGRNPLIICSSPLPWQSVGADNFLGEVSIWELG